MTNKSLELGDLIAPKESKEQNFSFIWEIVTNETEQMYVVNLQNNHTPRYKPLTSKEKSELKLFQGFEYFFVKSYDIMWANASGIADSYDILKEIIVFRKQERDDVGLCLRELVFRYFLSKSIDQKIVFENLYPAIVTAIKSDKNYLLNSVGQGDIYKAEATKAELEHLKGIAFELLSLSAIKAGYNCQNIAEEILVKPGYSLLRSIRENRDLQFRYSELLRSRTQYVTASYHPLDTSVYKPQKQELSTAFYDDIEPKAREHDHLLLKQRKMENQFQKKIEEAGYDGETIFGNDGLNSLFLDGGIKKFQKLLLANFAEHIPVGKEFGDITYYNDKLLFYLPAFRWIRPELFPTTVPGLSRPALRQQNLRRIKELITGNI